MKPAWVDEADEKLKVDISKQSRTRKLMQTEDETQIDGLDYAQRLQKLKEVQTSSALFDWAKPEKQEQKGFRAFSTEVDESSDDDPIGQLLKSNTSLFSKAGSASLKSGTLDFTKLRNACIPKHQHKSVVTSVNFHPTEENLMVTTGLDRRAKIV